MSAIKKKLSGAKWALVGLLFLIACLTAAYVAFAQGRTVTVKSRVVVHLSKVEQIEAGDVPGHLLEVGESRGLQIDENGEIANAVFWWFWDGVNGKGNATGYGVYTYEDGSTKKTEFEESTTGERGDDNIVGKGTFTFIGGTGRFKNIKGKGTFTNKKISDEADELVEFTGTYTLQ